MKEAPMRHRDIEEIDSLADEWRPDCPACEDVLDSARHVDGCRHRRKIR